MLRPPLSEESCQQLGCLPDLMKNAELAPALAAAHPTLHSKRLGRENLWSSQKINFMGGNLPLHHHCEAKWKEPQESLSLKFRVSARNSLK